MVCRYNWTLTVVEQGLWLSKISSQCSQCFWTQLIVLCPVLEQDNYQRSLWKQMAGGSFMAHSKRWVRLTLEVLLPKSSTTYAQSKKMNKWGQRVGKTQQRPLEVFVTYVDVGCAFHSHQIGLESFCNQGRGSRGVPYEHQTFLLQEV